MCGQRGMKNALSKSYQFEKKKKKKKKKEGEKEGEKENKGKKGKWKYLTTLDLPTLSWESIALTTITLFQAFIFARWAS